MEDETGVMKVNRETMIVARHFFARGQLKMPVSWQEGVRGGGGVLLWVLGIVRTVPVDDEDVLVGHGGRRALVGHWGHGR